MSPGGASSPPSEADHVPHRSSEPPSSASSFSAPRLVVIGNFDGVHRGHQAVLQRAAEEAQRAGWIPTVLTFDPHPAAVLGAREIPTLTTIERKVELLKRAVVDLEVHVEPFTHELARLSPEEFCRKVLVDTLHARAVIVGENFRFGRARAGDLATLRELGKKYGFDARAQALVTDERGPLSSTRIRTALTEGRVEDAMDMLGRPHFVVGQVSRGDGRGRSLGFPTANLEGICELHPRAGVYAVGAVLLGKEREYLGGGVANWGGRPTVDRPASCEVHLLERELDLYDKSIAVGFLHRLRDIEKFSSVEQLVEQIGRDAQAARQLISRQPDEQKVSWW